MTSIDLNCDMGELGDLQRNGTQARLMRYVSSVNIACGGHAGDERLMEATVREALEAGVAVGAHPAYPDRDNFGRVTLAIPLEDLTASILAQLRAFASIADAMGARIVHVKPHGALYNDAVSNDALAGAIASAVREWGRDVALVGFAGSQMLNVFADQGFRVWAEAFADRRYEPDGTLRSRTLPGAVLTDADEAAGQVIGIVRDGVVKAVSGVPIAVLANTVCLHSDTQESDIVAERIHRVLVTAGIAVRQIARP
jgi:UPF0271 protein